MSSQRVRVLVAAAVAAGHVLGLLALLSTPQRPANDRHRSVSVRVIAERAVRELVSQDRPPQAAAVPAAPDGPALPVMQWQVADALPVDRPAHESAALGDRSDASAAAALQGAQPASQDTEAQPARSVDRLASRAECPPADYPRLLRERGIEGRTALRVRLAASGAVQDVELLRTSGYRLFDEAALRRARACRYQPALQQGQPVESMVEFAVRFALQG